MNSSVCRVCLAGSTGEVTLQTMNNQLLEVYEKLTNAEVSSDNAKLCYICLSQLQKCYRFIKMARRSEQYLKTVLETDIKVKDEMVNNMLKIIKLQTLSVTTLKPIYLDGIQRKRPKNSLKEREILVNNEFTTKNIDEYNLLPNEEIKLVRNETVITKLEKFETTEEFDNYEMYENYEIDETECKDISKTETIDVLENANIIKKEAGTEMAKSNEKSFNTNIEEEIKEDIKDKTDIIQSTDGMHENITQVTDYVVIYDTELYYECDICHDMFTTRDELTTHQSKHISDKNQITIEEIIKNLPYTKRPYCPICKKFFAGYTSQLIEHLKIHTGERPFICDSCGHSSRTKHHLQEHIRTHTKEKVYCKICDKSFSQMSSLGKHMLIHTGQCPHFCHLCGKSFTQSGQLRMHIRAVHEGIKPHCCELCGKRFSNKSEWRRHMDSHAGIKAFACDRCGLRVTTNATLIRHKKRHCKMVSL